MHEFLIIAFFLPFQGNKCKGNKLYIVSPMALRRQTNAAQALTVGDSRLLGCRHTELTALYVFSSAIVCSTRIRYDRINELSFLHFLRTLGLLRESCAAVYGVIIAPLLG